MRIEQRVHIAMPREAVWNLVADTDRLNREMGLPPIRFTFEPQASGGTQAHAVVQIAGLTLRYREHPFEWVQPVFYHVRRTFYGGPMREIRAGAELHEEAGGTRVRVWTEIEPANVVSRPVCKAIGVKSIADFVSACRRFDAYLSGRTSTAYPRHSIRPPADRDRLEHAFRKLRKAGAEAALAERLTGYVEHASPADLAAMRPFALADAWGVPRMVLLETCLLAVQTGLLDLRWRVLCPFCRGGPPGVEHLNDLSDTAHCETCNIRFDALFDRSVEVCFSVSRAIRPLQETTYCIGGPRLSPHVLAQWVLDPHSRQKTALTLAPRRYTVASVKAEASLQVEVAEEGASSLCLEVQPQGTRKAVLTTAGPAAVGPNAVWTLVNDTEETVVLRLEIPEWTTDAATAALVTSLPAFRDRFSSEVLSPGTEMAIRQVCILFSDLKGSTAMYRVQGDAPSYRAVRDHFTWMRCLLDRHEGALVKTIGDAVMATFHDPAAALAAACAIQKRAQTDPAGLVIKLGLHWGPAIAVNANERLDYFGQTVNLAARLQRESEGGDIVLAAAMAADPRVARLLEEPGVVVERFESPVRGLDEPVAMLRLRLKNLTTEDTEKHGEGHSG